VGGGVDFLDVIIKQRGLVTSCICEISVSVRYCGSNIHTYTHISLPSQCREEVQFRVLSERCKYGVSSTLHSL